MEQKLRRDRRMGDNLRKLRLERHLSQEKLCAELQRRGCGIGRSTYEKYERGELNIRISVLIALRDIFTAVLMTLSSKDSRSFPNLNKPSAEAEGCFLCSTNYFVILHD